MEKKIKKKILFLMQYPPPIHGVSVMNNYVFSSLFLENDSKRLVKLNFSKKINELRKITLGKIIRSVGVFFHLLYNLIFFNPQIVCFTIFPTGKSFYRDSIYLLLLKFFNPKIILFIHNIGIATKAKNKFKKKMVEQLFNNVNIIVLSVFQKRLEFDKFSLKSTKIFVLKNGIEVVNINKYISPKDDVLRLLFLSNFFDNKGLFLLVDAFQILLENNHEKKIKLIIAGQDFNENYQKLNKIIKEKKLQNFIDVKLDVFGDEKWKLYGMADIFVFPSYFVETSSLVVLEAMQFGLPIVASATGAISEMLIDNNEALLFLPKDKECIVQKLQYLIDNEKKRTILGNNAREEFLNKYTIDKYRNNLQEIFNQVLNG